MIFKFSGCVNKLVSCVDGSVHCLHTSASVLWHDRDMQSVRSASSTLQGSADASPIAVGV